MKIRNFEWEKQHNMIPWEYRILTQDNFRAFLKMKAADKKIACPEVDFVYLGDLQATLNKYQTEKEAGERWLIIQTEWGHLLPAYFFR